MKLRIQDSNTLRSQIEDFLNHLFDSPRTADTYKNSLKAFFTFLEETHTISARKKLLTIQDVDTNVLQDFQAWLGLRNYSRFSQRTYLAGVNAFLNYALSQDWLPDS